MNPEHIIAAVEYFTGYALDELQWEAGESLKRARWIAMWLLCDAGIGRSAAARLLRRNPRAVSYGIVQIDDAILKRDVETVRVLICARLWLRERRRMAA